MLLRQQAILRLLLAAGGNIERLRLVKLMFLASAAHELASRAAYDFLPYRFGPHSFTLYRDWANLVQKGLGVEATRDRFHLSDQGSRFAGQLDNPHLEVLDRTHERYEHLTTEALIDFVYERWPWFTVNSERVTNAPKPSRPDGEIKVYTVGYEGVSVDRLLNRLMELGIKVLVDVRANPTARRFGFHKSTLMRLCDYVSIGYVHEPLLGVDQSRRRRLAVDLDYESFMSDYVSKLGSAQLVLDRVAGLISKSPSVLMCYEADPKHCHRLPLSRILNADLRLGVEQVGL